MSNPLLNFLITIIITFFFSCSENKIVGGCTETSNQALIFNPDGTPAGGTRVLFVPANYLPNSVDKGDVNSIDSTMADNNGIYQFSELNDGTYNIWYNKNDKFAYRSNLLIENGLSSKVVRDTLSVPSKISGVVKLLPEHDPREVYLLLIGSERYTRPIDSIGNFIFEDIPEGKYVIRCLTSYSDYGFLDTTVQVKKGEMTQITDTLYLPYLRLPVPDSIQIFYDTLTQIVKLEWQCKKDIEIYGFNIYRKKNTEDRFSLININPSKELQFFDSTIIKSSDNALEFGCSYIYRISAVDSAGVVGNGGKSDNVTICSAYKEVENTKVDSIGRFGEGNLEFGIDGMIYYVSSRVPAVKIIDPHNFKDQKTFLIPDSAYPFDISQLVDSTLVIATDNGVYHLDSRGEFLYWYNLSLLEFETYGDSCIYYAKRESQEKFRSHIISFNMKTGKSESINLNQNNDSTLFDISSLCIDGDSAIVLVRRFNKYQTIILNLKNKTKDEGVKFSAQGMIYDFTHVDKTLVLLGEKFISCYIDGKIVSRCFVKDQIHLVSVSSNNHVTVGSHGTIRRYEY